MWSTEEINKYQTDESYITLSRQSDWEKRIIVSIEEVEDYQS
jgi:hypothetical protein